MGLTITHHFTFPRMRSRVVFSDGEIIDGTVENRVTDIIAGIQFYSPPAIIPSARNGSFTCIKLSHVNAQGVAVYLEEAW